MKSEILKKISKSSAVFPAKFYYRIRFFSNFPHTLGILGCVENCETFTKLHGVGWKNGNVKFVPRPGF